jgi:hypothetical protein
MELLEITAWMAAGFVPTYVALELGYRSVAKKITSRLFITADSEKMKGRS